MFIAPMVILASMVLPPTFGYYYKEYNIGVPNGKTLPLEHRISDSGGWITVPDDLGGLNIGGNFSPSKVGWRLKDVGDSSSIVYTYDPSVEPLIVEIKERDHEAGVFWTHTINQDYPTTGISATKREVWNEGEFVPLPFLNRVLRGSNSECDYGMKIKIEVWDVNGNYQVVDGTDVLEHTVPNDAFPINATISANEFGTYAELYISGEEPILYAVGGGVVPTINTRYVLDVQFCPG